MHSDSHYSSQLFSVTFDALLVGHEAGVTSLSWRPQKSPSDLPTLLSTSTDSSLILWSPSTVLTSSTDGTTLWINRQRFGDVGGQRLGGFVGGVWALNGDDAMAWGWNGGWRRWRCINPGHSTSEPSALGPALEEWSEVGAITGHRAPVRSVAWSPGGEYLISARYVSCGVERSAIDRAPIVLTKLRAYTALFPRKALTRPLRRRGCGMK